MKCRSFLFSLLLWILLLSPTSTLPRMLLRRATDSDAVSQLFLQDPPEEEDVMDDEPKARARREHRPLSIDLTFHLLRNLIHNARTEEQQQLRVRLNRKMLDEIGK
ncbi:urotensin 1 [Corythoichthys intestinalis]|uniref:urotensin 1 n=1 Tax=Corythoichthys intestinalis TaxID=161448 RepID=UPI0025A5235A|nr:urotensin 1 [Corythoichthys intestinalis]